MLREWGSVLLWTIGSIESGRAQVDRRFVQTHKWMSASNTSQTNVHRLIWSAYMRFGSQVRASPRAAARMAMVAASEKTVVAFSKVGGGLCSITGVVIAF